MNSHFYSLAKHPNYFDQMISLIEVSFGYSRRYSYAKDFLPLTHASNWENLFFTLNEKKEVISCGGLRHLKIDQFKVAFIGGIATHPSHRGQGLGTEMINFLLSRLTECDFIVLWSEKTAFYHQFNFKEFGFLHENEGKDWMSENPFRPLSSLSQTEQKFIKSCFESYYTGNLVTPQRKPKDWEIFFQMESIGCSLFDWGYILHGKGMDLAGLIHEAACLPGYETDLSLILGAYSYWLRGPRLETGKQRFAGLIKIQKNEFLLRNLSDQIFIPGFDSI